MTETLVAFALLLTLAFVESSAGSDTATFTGQSRTRRTPGAPS
jgi:hypothetical protein